MIRFMITTIDFEDNHGQRTFDKREEAESLYDQLLREDYRYRSVIFWEAMRGWDETATKHGGPP